MSRDIPKKSNDRAAVFKAYPEFSRLTLADKPAYEKFISNFSPLADISFAGLMLWWNSLNSASVASLNGNLVISYWLPGDDIHSGLCLIGSEGVDEAICTIFDHLKEIGEEARLVHVPDFVISALCYPKLYRFEAEPDYDEAVYSITSLYPLAHLPPFRRKKIEKQLRHYNIERIVVKSLDLDHRENQLLLRRFAIRWGETESNNVTSDERETILQAIELADTLGIENVCLYVEEELVGFLLYELPTDKRYAIGTFWRVDDSIPDASDLMLYFCTKWFADQGINYLNFEQDLGIDRLRAEKLSLAPANFFRKYTIRPSTG